MGKLRDLVFGGLIGALAGVVLAPRRGESRRDALGRLRLAVRPGRGSFGAFAGTPCAAQARADVQEREQASSTDGGAPAAAGGDEDG